MGYKPVKVFVSILVCFSRVTVVNVGYFSPSFVVIKFPCCVGIKVPNVQPESIRDSLPLYNLFHCERGICLYQRDDLLSCFFPSFFPSYHPSFFPSTR